jgi:hypothetical protein
MQYETESCSELKVSSSLRWSYQNKSDLFWKKNMTKARILASVFEGFCTEISRANCSFGIAAHVHQDYT